MHTGPHPLWKLLAACGLLWACTATADSMHAACGFSQVADERPGNLVPLRVFPAPGVYRGPDQRGG